MPGGRSLGTGRPPFVNRAGPRQQWPQGFPAPAVCLIGPGLPEDPHLGPKTTAKVSRWELGDPGSPRTAQALGPSGPKPHIYLCPGPAETKPGRGLETSALGRQGSGQESGSSFDGLRGGRKPTGVVEDRARDLGSCFLLRPL